jgi:hypothetical protein
MSVLSMLAEPNVESGANIEVSPGLSRSGLAPRCALGWGVGYQSKASRLMR